MSTKNENQKNEKNKIVRILVTIIAVALIIAGIAMTASYVISTKKEKDTDEQFSSIITTDPTADNPIDFATLKETNDEIYAWLTVPNTNVDHPVLQSTESDDFYLKHSAYDKEYSPSGAIYTQSLNSKSFNDRVTVIYGHNNYGDTFFTTLHNFEDEDFFNSNPYFYIYTPESKLTYQVISAFKYDDRHILNSFDFTNNNTFTEFTDMIQNPNSTMKNVRSQLDAQINNESKIVILSTCITNQKSNRYLVCGLLVKTESAKYTGKVAE